MKRIRRVIASALCVVMLACTIPNNTLADVDDNDNGGIGVGTGSGSGSYTWTSMQSGYRFTIVKRGLSGNLERVSNVVDILK